VFQSQRDLMGAVGWTLCAGAFFAEFGSMSLVGWATFVVVGVVPSIVFVLLAGDPPITIAEVLFNAEKDNGGSVYETRR
jgi:hypothetical protein